MSIDYECSRNAHTYLCIRAVLEAGNVLEGW